jgi:4'-phosphopantetheinyl transferase
LDDGAVHVWRAALDLEPAAIEELRLALSPDELERAARFRNPAAQSRFISARGILRDILSRYLDRKPAALTFDYQPHGKPFLLPAAGMVQFNLSHSQGMALYGITRGREIGVDVEMARRGPDQERIAERFFSAREWETMKATVPERRTEFFFRCWTLKEAYLKARGEGLSIPLGSVDVVLAPGELAALLRVAGEPAEAERWALSTLLPAPGYWAAVAVEGRDLRPHLFDWQPKS